MTPEQIIQTYRDAPVGESIGAIAESLASRSVFVGIEGDASTQPSKLQFKVAADKQGGLWAYAYTSEAEFSKAFPQGGRFAEMGFADLFETIEADQRFAGIYLNSASDTFYPISRALFSRVKQQLRQPAE